MANTILLKKTGVAARVPETTDLQLGEVAINTADGRLFSKKRTASVDSIIEFLRTDGDASSLTNLPLMWHELASKWDFEPSVAGTIVVNSHPGSIYSYTLAGTTRYRFVPDIYSASLDGFYAGYSAGVGLSDLICTRATR